MQDRSWRGFPCLEYQGVWDDDGLRHVTPVCPLAAGCNPLGEAVCLSATKTVDDVIKQGTLAVRDGDSLVSAWRHGFGYVRGVGVGVWVGVGVEVGIEGSTG